MTMVHHADRGTDGQWVHRVFRGATHVLDFLDEEGTLLEDGWAINDDPDLETSPFLDEDSDPCLWVDGMGREDFFLVRDLLGRHGEAERERLQDAIDHA